MTHTRISTKDRESLDEQINHERASFEIAAAERDRLREVNRELVAALIPFADVDGEGDEDFPNETKVMVSFGRTIHYLLTLGDLRRARAALAKAEETP